MGDTFRGSRILFTFTLFFTGCGPAGGGCSSAPPASTPVLEDVFKPGTTLTNLGIDSNGEFEALPSPSVIVWFRAPYPTGVEVTVNGVILEQTSDIARQQTLESQGLGFWLHRSGSPNLNVAGTPRWDIAVAAPPALRTSERFTIGLTDTSSNSTTPRSGTLTVKVAIGIPDWVSVPFNPENDSQVVLLDGQRISGCVDDELWRGNHIIDVGDMRASGGCNEEIVVFTKGNAVQLFAKLTSGIWTDSLRDFALVNLNSGLLQVPVDVWLLGAGLQTRATADFANADMIYDTSRCGVAFNPTFKDVSGTPAAAALFGTNINTMQNAAWRAALAGSAFFTTGRINVYYVGSPFSGQSASGFNASPYNSNIIGVDTTAQPETLAHELGHSFTLLHTTGLPGFLPTNLMMTGVTGRNALTEGQCFRVNVNKTSSLNTNLVRGGFIRDCPDGTTNSTCPPLSFDVP
ncbi:MAG TPA: hypothetical protein VN943_03365 [Candidatus Acidoferrum sp.]|nr:hypothetical protein [Candidatus Acidoferrum sp.]